MEQTIVEEAPVEEKKTRKTKYPQCPVIYRIKSKNHEPQLSYIGCCKRYCDRHKIHVNHTKYWQEIQENPELKRENRRVCGSVHIISLGKENYEVEFLHLFEKGESQAEQRAIEMKFIRKEKEEHGKNCVNGFVQHESNRMHCDLCNCSFFRSNKIRHLKTEKHKQATADKETVINYLPNSNQ